MGGPLECDMDKAVVTGSGSAPAAEAIRRQQTQTVDRKEQAATFSSGAGIFSGLLLGGKADRARFSARRAEHHQRQQRRPSVVGELLRLQRHRLSLELGAWSLERGTKWMMVQQASWRDKVI